MNEKKVVKGNSQEKILKRYIKTFACFSLALFLISGCAEKGPESAVEDSSGNQTVPESSAPPSTETAENNISLPVNVTITVIYDNRPYNPELTPEWGFSCLIEGYEKTILFDTGGNGTILSANMQKLGIDPEGIDVIVLSHIHGDHVDGLPSVLRQNNNVTVYVPQSFPFSLKEDVRKYGAEVVEVSQSIEICEHVYSAGEIQGPVNEQSLILRTDKGLVIITGCAHPGVVRIVRKAKDLFQDDILLVMGGFHLDGFSMSDIEGIISDFRALGVLYAGPCHCSGSTAMALFKEEYGEKYIEIGVGTIIHVKDLV